MKKVIKNHVVNENRTQINMSDSNVRFSQEQSDAFIVRLKSVISTESLSSFANRCGFGESLLRKYLNGAIPGADKVTAIAEKNGRTVQWLLTGDWPEHKSDLRRALEYASIDPSEIVKNFTGIDITNKKYPGELATIETTVTELRTDRRVSQATFKEAQGVADVDYRLLEMAEVAVHKFLADEEVVAPPERVAKLVLAIYMYAASKGKVSLDELNHFLKLVAVF